MFLDKTRWVKSNKPSRTKSFEYNKDLGLSSTSQANSEKARARQVRQGHNIRPRSADNTILRSRRQSSRDPAVVEVLSIIDKEMFKHFNYSMTELGLFLLHYWQAVREVIAQ